MPPRAARGHQGRRNRQDLLWIGSRGERHHKTLPVWARPPTAHQDRLSGHLANFGHHLHATPSPSQLYCPSSSISVEMENNLPVNVREYQELAKKALPKMHYDYINGGAEDEHTLRDNMAAYGRILLRPRVLVDVSNIDMSTNLLGYDLPSPIIVAPTGSHKLANPEGEVATARAAASCNTLMVLSFSSSCKIEEVASSCNAIRFYQLYVFKNRDVSATLVRRAENIRNKMVAPANANLEGLMPIDDLDTTDGSKLEKYARDTLDPSLSWKWFEGQFCHSA
ncbi:hypothetical protein ZWY2020_008989 [Hordeum vulgare]|nr:hypothetical protein ZWY2020_008989 [Hordeum vulgare]